MWYSAILYVGYLVQYLERVHISAHTRTRWFGRRVASSPHVHMMCPSTLGLSSVSWPTTAIVCEVIGERL